MKQISTGAGLVALSVGMVATAFIATHRSGGEAFAQGTGTERRIVAAGVYAADGNIYGIGTATHWAYRVWSDNITEVKYLGDTKVDRNDSGDYTGDYPVSVSRLPRYTSNWQAIDDGTVAFRPTDIDRSGQIDSGDIAQVLLDFNETVDQTTPPPIDCNINGLR